MKLGDRLQELRESKGYMQKEIADKLGIAPNTLSGYERGLRKPDSNILRKIAIIYGVTVDYLLNGEDSVTESKTEHRLKMLARKADNLTEEERESLIKHFEDSIDIYLKAKNIDINK